MLLIPTNLATGMKKIFTCIAGYGINKVGNSIFRCDISQNGENDNEQKKSFAIRVIIGRFIDRYHTADLRLRCRCACRAEESHCRGFRFQGADADLGCICKRDLLYCLQIQLVHKKL